MSLKRIQENKNSLETVLCDLNNKVSLETAETVKLQNEYREKMQKANEKWESYKEVYESFPLAVKKREMLENLRKIESEIENTQKTIAEIKLKNKQQTTDRENRQRVWIVELAKQYLENQENTAKNSELSKEKRKLEDSKKDIKAGKKQPENAAKPNKLFQSQGMQEILSPPRTMQYEAPQLDIFSPTSVVNMSNQSEAPKSKLFDWSSLLTSGSSLLSLTRNTQKKAVEGNTKIADIKSSNTAIKSATQASMLDNLLSESRKKEATKKVENFPPQKSTTPFKEYRAPPPLQQTSEDCLSTKNKVKLNSKVPAEKHVKQSVPPQKNKLQNTQTTKEINIDNTPNKSKTSVLKEMDKIKSIEPRFNQAENEKENLKPTGSSNCSKIKDLMKSFNLSNLNQSGTPYQHGKSTEQNFLNVLSMKKYESQSKTDNAKKRIKIDLPVPMTTESHPPQENSITKNHFQNDYSLDKNVEENLLGSENNEKPTDNAATAVMDPFSPPDVIPAENNSQSSQNNVSQNLSQSFSDFMSPLEMNENEKLHYQRIAAESPEFVYPRGPGFISGNKEGAEVAEVTVRSQYFPNMEPQSNAGSPTMMEEDYPSVYSPPMNYSAIASPPPANLGRFEFGKNNSSVEMSSLFGGNSATKNQPTGDSGFNFMSGPAKPKTSVFNLFS